MKRLHLLIVAGVLLTSSSVWASSPDLAAATSSAPMAAIKWGLVTTCFCLGILRILASEALDGQLRLNWMSLIMRLLCVCIFLTCAGSIQGSIWKGAQSLGDNLLPGPTLYDVNSALYERAAAFKEVRQAEAQQQREAQQRAEGVDFDVPFEMRQTLSEKGLLLAKSIGSSVVNAIGSAPLFEPYTLFMGFLENIALSIFFFLYKFIQQAQECIMLFLAAMAPFLITPSIIPGVNSWSSWVKLVLCVALWPVVAGFMIKGQMMSVASVMAGPSGTGGSLSTFISSDAKNLFINMDSLNLLGQAVIYGFMILSSPFIASAVVYGGGHALGMGLSMATSTATRMAMAPAKIVKGAGGAAGRTAFNGGGGGGGGNGSDGGGGGGGYSPKPTSWNHPGNAIYGLRTYTDSAAGAPSTRYLPRKPL